MTMDFSLISTLVRLMHWQTHLPYAHLSSIVMEHTAYGDKNYYDLTLTISNGVTHHFAIVCDIYGARLG